MTNLNFLSLVLTLALLGLALAPVGCGGSSED